ncbi:MAG: DUF2200 family protein [Schleiferiaceae bacterium]
MPTTDERIAAMTLASVYPHYRAKLERKGVDPGLTDNAIRWLTQCAPNHLQMWLNEKWTFTQIFDSVQLHPNASLIKGVICGWRVEEIENPLSQKVRYLDKLIDELAKGRAPEKVFRTA